MVEREEVLARHKDKGGKIEVAGRVRVGTEEEMSTFYTPGVAYVCLAIKEDPKTVYSYTMKGRTVAIVTDGTRILGLGNIGPDAGLPVMEGKSLLLKKFGGVDAIPVGINDTDEDRIVETIKSIRSTFGAVNLEDIETPKCFRIFDRLKAELDIPVFHDDRNGVGVVALAALINSLKIAGKRLQDAKIVINGTGAAGTGIAEMLDYAGAKDILMVDTYGTLYKGRQKGMHYMKERLAGFTNRKGLTGSLEDAARNADVLIGASAKGAFTKEMIAGMSTKPIVFALANPEPEIEYQDAIAAGAFIAATGRSDMPNQVNNLTAFPGILRGALEARAKSIDQYMLFRAAKAIAQAAGKNPQRDSIMPRLTDRKVAVKLVADVAAEVASAAAKQGLAQVAVDAAAIRKRTRESLKRYEKIERLTSR